MLAVIGGFSVNTAACIKNCANNALGITVYRQTQLMAYTSERRSITKIV